MIKILLTAAIIYFLAIGQSALMSEIFSNYLKPDLMLILIVYLGLYNAPLPGAIKILAGGLFYDSLSGGPFGLFSTIYLAIFFLIKLAEKVLILGETKIMQMSLLGLASIFQYLSLPFLLFALGIWESYSLPRIKWLVPQMVMTWAFAWPLFDFFRKILLHPHKESSAVV